jgi:hypothetical protein
MSPNKTLYIRDDDMSVWEQAERAASNARQPMSQLVVGLLREHLNQLVAAQDEITVNMRDENGREWIEAFRGRWLIEPDDGNRFGLDAGACYGIAQTAKGKIAVYQYHVNDRWPPTLQVYEDLDDAQHSLCLVIEATAAAAAELGQRRVIRRDI